jgi:hypothetical protein
MSGLPKNVQLQMSEWQKRLAIRSQGPLAEKGQTPCKVCSHYGQAHQAMGTHRCSLCNCPAYQADAAAKVSATAKTEIAPAKATAKTVVEKPAAKRAK